MGAKEQRKKERQDRLEEGKRLEDLVRQQMEAWAPDLQAIAYEQLFALGWRHDKAHLVKVKMGLTE